MPLVRRQLKRFPRWAWIICVGVAVVTVGVGGSVWRVHHATRNERWSMFPHTMACTVNKPAADNTDLTPPPEPAQVIRADLVHLRGDQVRLSMQFAQPPAPKIIDYEIGLGAGLTNGDEAVLIYPSNNSPTGWRAENSGKPNGDRLVSVQSSGAAVAFVVDLNGLKTAKVRFTRDIVVLTSSAADPTMYYSQTCMWDSAGAQEPGHPSGGPSVMSSAASSTPLASSGESAGCGPDEATAVRSALVQLPPDPGSRVGWSSTPVDSNYDPCADLSTVLVIPDGGAGGSPMQALMFHRGRYLGTATSTAHPFTGLLPGASNDTVVLTYGSTQSCTTCPGGGIVTTVRYWWDGTQVDMLDLPPPG